MESNPPPPTLIELELHHQTATAQVDEYFKKHGDSRELGTMQTALLHIEERIKELRSEMQIGVQEVRDQVGQLNTAVQIGVDKIKKNVEELNSEMLDGLEEIEHDVQELGNTTKN